MNRTRRLLIATATFGTVATGLALHAAHIVAMSGSFTLVTTVAKVLAR